MNSEVVHNIFVNLIQQPNFPSTPLHNHCRQTLAYYSKIMQHTYASNFHS